ncbi:MAG: 50S ribosomal protein L25 [Acidimicrobiia bacterium]|nr:50S ribosomal protein L25 [Acidimicrobiia bacterium]
MPDVLTAHTGRETGSRSAGRLRREGRVPAVVYGLGMDPVPVALDWVELRKVLVAGGTSSPVRLAVGGTEHLTVIRELQLHPIRRDVLHIDFFAIDPDLPVTISVPLVLAGLEEGDEAADIMLAVHEVEVTAKPNQLPSEVAVDAGAVREAGSLTVSDLSLPADVLAAGDPELVVVTMCPPRSSPSRRSSRRAPKRPRARKVPRPKRRPREARATLPSRGAARAPRPSSRCRRGVGRRPGGCCGSAAAEPGRAAPGRARSPARRRPGQPGGRVRP